MSDQIMQLTTFEIHEGHLDQFKESIAQAVTFAEANGPQLMVEVYLDEQAMRAHSCQIFANSVSILAHWALADPHIQSVMEHCTLKRLDVFGRPSDAVLAGIDPLRMQGVEVTVTPSLRGFGRFCSG